MLSKQDEAIYGYITEQLATKQTGIKLYTAADGTETCLDIAYVPSTNWAAISYVPNAEVMSALHTLTQLLVSIAIATIVLLFAIFFFVVRFVVIKPLQEIDYVARQIAAGQLNESIQFRARDEFGALAINFNQTVARLRD